MIFKTIGGNSVNLRLDQYKIKWRKPSLSKFQTRIKAFFEKNFKDLDWYEEVPLVGKNESRLRWDFLCIYEDAFGRKVKVFIEVQGNHHYKMVGKFQKTTEDFHNQLFRDEVKVLFAKSNSNIPVLEFFEDDPNISLEWLKETYPEFRPYDKRC